MYQCRSQILFSSNDFEKWKQYNSLKNRILNVRTQKYYLLIGCFHYIRKENAKHYHSGNRVHSQILTTHLRDCKIGTMVDGGKPESYPQKWKLMEYMEPCSCKEQHPRVFRESQCAGFLYNWFAVTDTNNLAPAGWHIPTDDEWKTLKFILNERGCCKQNSMAWYKSEGFGKFPEQIGGQAMEMFGHEQSGFSAMPGEVAGFMMDPE